jgi:hypothetical protein
MEHANGPTLLAFGGHVVFESICICACSEEHAACKRAAQSACSFIGTKSYASFKLRFPISLLSSLSHPRPLFSLFLFPLPSQFCSSLTHSTLSLSLSLSHTHTHTYSLHLSCLLLGACFVGLFISDRIFGIVVQAFLYYFCFLPVTLATYDALRIVFGSTEVAEKIFRSFDLSNWITLNFEWQYKHKTLSLASSPTRVALELIECPQKILRTLPLSLGL